MEVGAVVAVRVAAHDHRLAAVLVLARARLPTLPVVMLLTTAILLPVLPEAFHVARLARPHARLGGQGGGHTRATLPPARFSFQS